MPRKLPPLGALRAFEAAARHASMVGAAAELGVTPGAISQQVKLLEAHLGAALFERRPQSLSLTASGRSYAAPLSDAFDAIAAATGRLVPRQGRSVLTLAMPALFAIGWLLPRLERFHAAHPGIKLRILSSHHQPAPAIAGIDAAIRHGRAGWGAESCVYLFNDALLPLCSPAYLPARIPPFAGHVLLAAETAPEAWPEWRAAIGAEDEPAGMLHFGDDGLTLQAAENGLGVALLDRHLAAEKLRQGRLVAATHQPPLVRGTAWYLVAPAARSEEAPFKALAQWLLGEAEGPMW